MKVREVIRILEQHDFHFVRQKGSHRRFKADVGGQAWLVTVPGALGDELPKGTLAAIRRQSGLRSSLFR